MRIGVYIDGYNVYYAARRSCGRRTAGWRWLDLRKLTESLIAEQPSWSSGSIERIVYCTARISAKANPGGHEDQDKYLRALKTTKSVDHIEYGNYVARVKHAPLAVQDSKQRATLYTSQWPVMVQKPLGTPVRNAIFMVSYLHSEEKGSDVNVATHLLTDVLGGKVDAAVVMSNDSDLKLPVSEARQRVPVGIVNPGKGYTALSGAPADGVGGHWWRSLQDRDFKRNQFEDPAAGRVNRPIGW